MTHKHHKHIQTITIVVGGIVAILTCYIAWDTHRDNKLKNELVELDKQIKELQLLKLKKTT